MWACGQVDLPKKISKRSDEQAVKVFSRLMLENKICEATRFLTERQQSGGIMSPDDDAGKAQGKSVL